MIHYIIELLSLALSAGYGSVITIYVLSERMKRIERRVLGVAPALHQNLESTKL